MIKKYLNHRVDILRALADEHEDSLQELGVVLSFVTFLLGVAFLASALLTALIVVLVSAAAPVIVLGGIGAVLCMPLVIMDYTNLKQRNSFDN